MPRRPKKKASDLNFDILNSYEPDVPIDLSALEGELLELVGSGEADEDGSDIDENDPRLLAELEAFVSEDEPKPKVPALGRTDQKPHDEGTASLSDIDQLVAAYYMAVENANAKQPANTAEARRFERVLSRLKGLADQIQQGQVVRLDELPPPPPPPPSSRTESDTKEAPTESLRSPVTNKERLTSATASPPVNQDSGPSSAITLLKRRCQEYKLAAVKYRDSNQTAKAREILKAYKCIEEAIPNVESGAEPFDPDNDMPPTPEEYLAGLDLDVTAPSSDSQPTPPSAATVPSATETVNSAIPKVMLSPLVTAENLQLRTEYFKKIVEGSENDPSEASKARRYRRVLDQYAAASKAFQRGVAGFKYSDLPVPPLCPKLSDSVAPQSGGAITSQVSGSPASVIDDKQQRTIAILKTRQNELKAAALAEKRSGNVDSAKNYLRSALSINPMIESVEAGEPLDISQLPRAPGLEEHTTMRTSRKSAFSGPILSGTVCEPPVEMKLEIDAAVDVAALNRIIEDRIISQNKESHELAEQMAQVGLTDASAKLIELYKYGKSSLKLIRSYTEQNRPVSYSFELANLPELNINHDLADGTLEVSVIRGISYNLPSDISSKDKLDTQVEIQLPHPQADNPQRHLTQWVKHTCDPDYSMSTGKFTLDTKSRSFQFLLKTNRGLKALIHYSRGIFRSTRILGTVHFPLNDLSHSATVKLVGDLMDGRKAIGGRLQIRLRQRLPLSNCNVITKSTPWLILTVTNQLEHTRSVSGSQKPSPSPRPDDGIGGSNNNQSSSRLGSTDRRVKFYSIALIDDECRYCQTRLDDPHVSTADREKYESRFHYYKRISNDLKQRLRGANSQQEISDYVEGLKKLAHDTRQLYDKAAYMGSVDEKTYYSNRLNIIRKELREYNNVDIQTHDR